MLDCSQTFQKQLHHLDCVLDRVDRCEQALCQLPVWLLLTRPPRHVSDIALSATMYMAWCRTYIIIILLSAQAVRFRSLHRTVSYAVNAFAGHQNSDLFLCCLINWHGEPLHGH